MSEQDTTMQADLYEIRVKGHLDDRWANWFDNLTITLEADGTTCLSGPVVDQAALYGILKKVRNLGLPLISLIPNQNNRERDTMDSNNYRPN